MQENPVRKYMVPLVAMLFLLLALEWNFSSVLASMIFLCYFLTLLFKAGEEIAFRPFILFLFSINYLFAPALMYNGLQGLQYYQMELEQDDYFSYAIPAILLLNVGLYSFKTDIFKKDLTLVKTGALVNVPILRQWVVGGIFLRLIANFLPTEIAFFIYLLSMLRFIGALGLFTIDKKKYWIPITGVLVFEIASALALGMFHDMMMWLIFFGLLFAYLIKPTIQQKLIVIVVAIVGTFILQLAKGEYRQRLEAGTEDNVDAFTEAVNASEEKSDEGLFDIANIAAALNRVNQAWIFTSTVKNLDNTQNFQEWKLLGIYSEAAFLPRILAPNKLTAGNRDIFNQFSGKKIGGNTSMGLGLLADGYISFGTVGVYAFAFCLGLVFSLIFRITQKWSDISPFFIFFIFPILNYAVRPDCETQTIMGHIVKSLFVYALLMRYYRKYFEKQFKIIEASGAEFEDDEEGEARPSQTGDFSLRPA